MSDIETEGTFRWTDGYLATWFNWYSGDYPGKDDKDSRDCVARSPILEGFWKMAKCHVKRHYYCETIIRKLN